MSAQSSLDGCELIPMSGVRSGEMDDVLEHERTCWQRELDWNYATTIAQIARSIEKGNVAGLALRCQRTVVAYVFYLADPARSLVGSAHALPIADEVGAVSELIDHILPFLIREVHTERVESQFHNFGRDDVGRVFSNWGFAHYRRRVLRADIERVLDELGRDGGALVKLIDPADIEPIGAIIHSSFTDTIDVEISSGYRSIEGCIRFVAGVVHRDGCGTFEPGASFLAPADDARGVIITSKIGPHAAHVVQLSVAADAQGRGLGSQLLRAACLALRKHGCTTVTLSVSLANGRAHQWYRDLGFETLRPLDAYVWSR